MEVIISLGSNVNQTENIGRAKVLLAERFAGIVFEKAVWTAPIGIQSDDFLNLTASFSTDLTKEDILLTIKRIESELGDSHSNHQKGIVKIDIDLIRYGNQRLREVPWLTKQP